VRQRLMVSSIFLLVASAAPAAGRATNQPALCDGCAVVRNGTLAFRDLNHDDILEPYEDWRRTPAERADDLVRRMTLEEKAGTMMHATVPLIGGRTGDYDLPATAKLIADRGITTFLTRLSAAPAVLAARDNDLQAAAAKTRLGIPLTISTDPRHHFEGTEGASLAANGFSQWPEPIGFGAIGDADTVRRFGNIAREEYRAVGIHQTLSPMADLSTEPRWARINGTFGEDAALTEKLVRAYVEGFQHGRTGLASDGVSAVVKHWVGYGAAKNGLDSHNSYGRYANFSSGQFALHQRPFRGAFAAGVTAVMPTYSILQGVTLFGHPLEQVGAGFSHQLLTDLLRKHYGFKGLIVSDWAITNDCGNICHNGFPPGETPRVIDFSTAWGVESLSPLDRFVKGVNAGIDQFGGVEDSDKIVEAVRSGRLTTARIEESVRRILIVKFEQGLFENPFVDAADAAKIAGSAEFVRAGLEAQVRSQVLLEARSGLLPLRPGVRVFLYHVAPAEAARFGLTVVTDPARADLAIMRLDTPFQKLHANYTFGSRQHEGDLSFNDGDPGYEELKTLSARIPVIASVYLDRPAILTNIRDKTAVLVGNFGASDTALFLALTGRRCFFGRLPFELPSSMAAVEKQASDAPHDSVAPLYRLHYGLRLRRFVR